MNKPSLITLIKDFRLAYDGEIHIKMERDTPWGVLLNIHDAATDEIVAVGHKDVGALIISDDSFSDDVESLPIRDY